MHKTPELNVREWVLLAVTALVIVGVFVGFRWVRPALDDIAGLRETIDLQTQRLQALTDYLSVREEADERFRQIGPALFQSENDQVTLTGFLRDIESTSRIPGLRIVNMKPLPIERHASHRVFPVQLTVSGPMDGILAFVANTAGHPYPVGFDSVTLRGAQGGNLVECIITMRTIRFQPHITTHERTAAAD